MLPHAFEGKAMELIFYYIDLTKNKDVRLAFDALRVRVWPLLYLNTCIMLFFFVSVFGRFALPQEICLGIRRQLGCGTFIERVSAVCRCNGSLALPLLFVVYGGCNGEDLPIAG